MRIDSPQEWEVTTLDSIIDFVIGGDWGKDAYFIDKDYTEVLCIRGSEFRNWDTEKGSTAALRKVKKSSLEKRKLKEGDILVEISGGGPEQPVGRVALIDKTVLAHQPDTPKICTNFFRLVRPVTQVDPEFLCIFLTFFYRSGEIVDYQAGSNNLRNLKFNDYIKMDIPLPPLPEQRRIVAKIEELFTQLDAGIASLRAAQAQLKTYRQALLAHAFAGKLTAQWRADNADTLEPADALLRRIAGERQTRHADDLAAWEAGGKIGRKPSPPQTVPPLTPAELADLPALPDGWAWVSIGFLLSEPLSNGRSVKSREGGFPVLRLTALKDGFVDLEESKEGDWGINDAQQYLVELNDFFVSRGNGSIKLVGRSGIVKALPRPIAYPDTMIKLRFPKEVEIGYINLIWNSRLIREQIEKSARTTAGIYKINQEDIRTYYIPLAPLTEQKQIVVELEHRLSVITTTDQTITSALQQAEALRQSILKKAFAGQLVPQNLEDEPAAALLARIRAGKE